VADRSTRAPLFLLYGAPAQMGNPPSYTLLWLSVVMLSASNGTFTFKPFDSHPTETAGWRGARLCRSIEDEEGRRWAENPDQGPTAATLGRRFNAPRTSLSSFRGSNLCCRKPQTGACAMSSRHAPALNFDRSTRRNPRRGSRTRNSRKLRREWPGNLVLAIEVAPRGSNAGDWPHRRLSSKHGRYLSERTVSLVGSTSLQSSDMRKHSDGSSMPHVQMVRAHR